MEEKDKNELLVKYSEYINNFSICCCENVEFIFCGSDDNEDSCTRPDSYSDNW